MPSEVNAALYALEVKIGREEIIASNEEKFVCRAPLCHLCFLYSIKMNKKVSILICIYVFFLLL
nr:unnamed protein product [Callosobruchus analis]